MKRLYHLTELATGRVLDVRELTRVESIILNNSLLSEFHRNRTADARKKLTRWKVADKETTS